MRGLIPLFLFSIAAVFSKGPDCAARCDRLHERSIKRIGFDEQKTTLLMEKQRPISTMKDVCWRLYDRLDCMKRCPQDREREKYARDVRFKCKPVLNELAKDLKCVSRYRSFMQVKCSTFLKEAVALRSAGPADSVPDRDTCRYLHLNSLCLENTVGSFCPTAKKVFRRLNFRDYFLNFIIPEDDYLFDDVDLDSCQIYDFVKSAKKISDQEIEEELTTIINKWEDQEKEKWVTPTMAPPKVTTERQEFTTLLNELLTSSESSEDPATTTTVSSAEISPTANWETSDETTLNRVFPGSPKIGEETSTKIMLTTKLDETTSYDVYTSTESSNGDGRSTTPLEDFSFHLTPPITTEATDVTSTGHSEEEKAKDEEDTTASVHPTTTFRRLFSDDSMEETPPNFFWSSARFSLVPEYTSTARYSTQRRDPIVQPVEVDTSTLFGEDDFDITHSLEEDSTATAASTTTIPSTTVPPPPVTTTPSMTSTMEITPVVSMKERTTTTASVASESTEPTNVFIHEDIIRGVPTLPSQLGSERGETMKTPVEYTPSKDIIGGPLPTAKGTTPLLHGGVIVKAIRKYGEADSEEEEHASESEKMQRSPMVDQEDLDRFMGKEEDYEYWPSETHSTEKPPSETGLSDKEVLLFIYLVLFGMALLSLICVLICCICCRKKNNHDVNKY